MCWLQLHGKISCKRHYGVCSVMSDPLWSHGRQQARLLFPLLSPGVCLNSHPLSQWCYPTISSSVTPFSFLPSIFPSSRVFSDESAVHIRWPKYWSLIFSISPSDEGWFPLGWTGLISLLFKWLSSLLQHHSLKTSILQCSAFFMAQLSHPYMTTGKTIVLTIWTFVSKVRSLLFNTLSRFVITFLPR